MQLALNTAHGWASYYGTPVEMVYHWARHESDEKVHPDDPETVGERLDTMFSYMGTPPYPVKITHEWDSSFFLAAKQFKELPQDLRRVMEHSIRHVHIETESDRGEFPMNAYPFHLRFCADWYWKDAPNYTKTIAYWDYKYNLEPPKNYKVHGIHQEGWDSIRRSLMEWFPEHTLVPLTYRDSFEHAYQVIRDCDFVVGYDGMWHMVARNFGKQFVSYTGDPYLANKLTVPNGIHHSNISEFIETLINMRDPAVLKWEKDYARSMHQGRLAYYTRGK